MNIKPILKYGVIIGLFLIPLTPLFVVDSFFFPFIGGKAFFFRIVVEIITALWIVLAAFDKQYRPKATALMFSVTAFALIALLADVFGVHPLKAIWSNFERMEGWLLISHLWLYFVVMSSVFTEKKWWTRWFNMTLAVSLIVAFKGLGQLMGAAEIHQSADRIDSYLGNSAYLAVYALIHMFIAAYQAIGKFKLRQNVWVVIYVISIILNGFVLFYTQTRGSMVGVALGTFIAFAYYAYASYRRDAKHHSSLVHEHRDGAKHAVHHHKFKPARTTIITGTLCIIMIVLAVSFWSIRDSEFVKNNRVLNRFSSASLFNKQSQGRAYIWPMAIKGFQERPILGWGQEGFNYVFNKYYDPHMWRHEQWFDRAHNVFLDWLIAGGILGLISYLSLYILALWILIKSDLPVAEKAALIGLLVAYTIHNIFVFDNISSYVLFFSLLAYAQYEHVQKNKDNVGIVFGEKQLPNDAILYGVAPVALVALVVSMYFVNIRSINANTTLIQALISCNQPTGGEKFEEVLAINDPTSKQETREQLLMCTDRVLKSNADNAMKTKIYGLVMEQSVAQITEAPLDARGYLFTGSLLQNLGNIEEAKKYLTKAQELSPQKQGMRFPLVVNYVQEKKYEEGLRLAEETYNLDPEYDQSKFYYGAMLIYNKRIAEGEKILDTVPQYYDSSLVTQAYIEAKEYSRVLESLSKKKIAEPNNIQVRVSIAAVYMKQNRRAEAIKELNELPKIIPGLKPQVDAWVKDILAGKNPVQD